MDDYTYLDHAATTPLDPRVRDAMAPFLDGAVRQPLEPAPPRPRGARRPRGRARRGRRADRRPPGRDRLHGQRHRGRQPGDLRRRRRPGGAHAHRDERLRAPRRARTVPAPRTPGRRSDLPAGGRRRHRAARVARRGAAAHDAPRVGHGRQQRRRHRAAHRRARGARHERRRAVPHRRRAGGRQAAARRRPPAHRPALAVGPQAARAQGRRRAVRARRRRARAARARRRSGARAALGDRERRRHRRLRPGRVARPRRDGRGLGPPGAATATACSRPSPRRSTTPTSSATRTGACPGHLCLGFSGQEADAIRLLFALDDAGIAVSSGSACSAHNAGEPSYVLTAMGFDTIRARGSLRVTMGRFTTERRHRPPARSAPQGGGVAHLDRLARRLRRALVKERHVTEYDLANSSCPASIAACAAFAPVPTWRPRCPTSPSCSSAASRWPPTS